MTTVNVGKRESAARVLVASFAAAVAWIYVFLNPSPASLLAASVVWIGGALLVRSARNRYCPIHDAAGINTCPTRADGGQPCHQEKSKRRG